MPDRKQHQKNDPPQNEHDPFALGMTCSGDKVIDLSPELDAFQFGFFREYLAGMVMEIGAGPGRTIDMTLNVDSVTDLTVIEPSDHFHALLQKRFAGLPRLTLIKSETHEIRERFRHHFNAIYSLDVMEHVADDRAFLEDCLAMLKPGGYFIAQVPAFQCLFSRLDRNIGHYRRYDRAMMHRLVEGLPVSIEKCVYHNMIGLLASFFVVKLGRIEFQSGPRQRDRFLRLYTLYSRYIIPLVRVIEKRIPVPFGLNITVVLQKNAP